METNFHLSAFIKQVWEYIKDIILISWNQMAATGPIWGITFFKRASAGERKFIHYSTDWIRFFKKLKIFGKSETQLEQHWNMLYFVINIFVNLYLQEVVEEILIIIDDLRNKFWSTKFSEGRKWMTQRKKIL